MELNNHLSVFLQNTIFPALVGTTKIYFPCPVLFWVPVSRPLIHPIYHLVSHSFIFMRLHRSLEAYDLACSWSVPDPFLSFPCLFGCPPPPAPLQPTVSRSPVGYLVTRVLSAVPHSSSLHPSYHLLTLHSSSFLPTSTWDLVEWPPMTEFIYRESLYFQVCICVIY